MPKTPKKIVLVGGGPSGLMAAQRLSLNPRFDVHLYEQKASVGRKFLIAGRGGLNLTHSESADNFSRRYGPAEPFMIPLLTAFSPADVQAWAADLGIETFTGSSGRLFPKEMKATGLMRAWTKRLTEQGVTFHLRHRFSGFDENRQLRFKDKENNDVVVSADAVLFGLGGASYGHLGSTGAWASLLAEQGADITDFKPVNCGYDTRWSAFFIGKFEGQPIKNIAITYDEHSARGDLVVTGYGIEGGAIYALSRVLTAAFDTQFDVPISLDLCPDMSEEQVRGRLSSPRGKQSQSSFLRKKLHLSPLEIALLREGNAKDLPQKAEALAKRIKYLPIDLTAPRPLTRAISTAGGLVRSELDSSLMLKNHPGWFAAGEMIDWDAPTGGYLLQGCFSTAVAAAKGIENWLETQA